MLVFSTRYLYTQELGIDVYVIAYVLRTAFYLLVFLVPSSFCLGYLPPPKGNEHMDTIGTVGSDVSSRDETAATVEFLYPTGAMSVATIN